MKKINKRFNAEAVLSEFVGTFFLAFTFLAALMGSIPLLAPPLAAGLVLAMLVVAIGPISGAHVNPAVSIGMYTLKKIDFVTLASYVFAQFTGALVAMVVLSLFNNGAIFELGGNMLWETFWAEMLGATVFGFGIGAMAYNDMKQSEAAVVVGGSFVVGLLFAGIASNAVINPTVAISLGSATWPYVFGPIFGLVLGINLYHLLIIEPPKKKLSKD